MLAWNTVAQVLSLVLHCQMHITSKGLYGLTLLSGDVTSTVHAQVWGTGVKMEMLLRTMGLSRAADTLVGNNLIRGVSGGERKRVTSAEHLVGPKVR